jgi:hypothetical protein
MIVERVRELGDISVPFKYDTHALVFSDDAVDLEAKTHERLADRRLDRYAIRTGVCTSRPSASTRLL